MGSRQKGYDLNTLLHVANISAPVAAAYAYRLVGENDYVDVSTLYAACLLCFTNVVALRYERRHKDPFIVVLVTMTVLFYLIRVATLFLVPWSWSLEKSGSGPDEVNQALIFIACANLAMCAGLAVAERGKRRDLPSVPSDQRLPHLRRIILLVIISIISSQLISEAGMFGRVAGFLSNTFLNTYFLVMITVLYVSMSTRKLHPMYVGAIFGLFALFFVRAVLVGSRSALLQVAMFGLISLLSQDRRIRVSGRILAVGLALSFLAPYLYFVGTYSRNVKPGEEGAVSIDAIVRLEGTTASGVPNRDVLFERMFGRAGYLDAATAMMAGRDKYSEAIGVVYVIESAIDNALTPGFDVFDRAKIALVLGDLDRGARQAPRRSELSVAEYNSDMMTAYGEAYLLFGYGGLILLFVGAFAVKRVYLRYRGRQVFEVYIYRSLVIWCWYNWINSYGMDWLLSEVIIASVFFVSFRLYCAVGGRSGPVVRVGRSNVKGATLPHTVLIPLHNQGSA